MTDSDSRYSAANAAVELLSAAGFMLLGSDDEEREAAAILAHCFGEFERDVLYGILLERDAPGSPGPEQTAPARTSAFAKDTDGEIRYVGRG